MFILLQIISLVIYSIQAEDAIVKNYTARSPSLLPHSRLNGGILLTLDEIVNKNLYSSSSVIIYGSYPNCVAVFVTPHQLIGETACANANNVATGTQLSARIWQGGVLQSDYTMTFQVTSVVVSASPDYLCINVSPSLSETDWVKPALLPLSRNSPPENTVCQIMGFGPVTGQPRFGLMRIQTKVISISSCTALWAAYLPNSSPEIVPETNFCAYATPSGTSSGTVLFELNDDTVIAFCSEVRPTQEQRNLKGEKTWWFFGKDEEDDGDEVYYFAGFVKHHANGDNKPPVILESIGVARYGE